MSRVTTQTVSVSDPNHVQEIFASGIINLITGPDHGILTFSAARPDIAQLVANRSNPDVANIVVARIVLPLQNLTQLRDLLARIVPAQPATSGQSGRA